MASKKKLEVVIKITDEESLQKYLSTEYNKLVCLNVYDKYWGPVEVLDPHIKKLLDGKDYSGKTDFVSCDKDITGELFSKYVFNSKPKYFILHVN
jgi:hypothetical protein